jgi:chorismate mutase
MWKENWRFMLKASRFLIDALDFLLMGMLWCRMQICKVIGRTKIRHNLSVYVPEREKEILRKRQKQARKFGFSEKAVRILAKTVMWESRRIQKGLAGV